MRPSLLKKFHQIFLFPGRNEKDYEDPYDDPAMKKINKHSLGSRQVDLSEFQYSLVCILSCRTARAM